jgi:hypothetical protein
MDRKGHLATKTLKGLKVRNNSNSLCCLRPLRSRDCETAIPPFPSGLVGFGRIQAPASDPGFRFPVSAEVNGEVLVAGMETAEPIPRSG